MVEEVVASPSREVATGIESRGRRLLWHGMLLFILGLVTGLIAGRLHNPRMGLAAHLEGLMNGTFLLALGSAWRLARLGPRTSRVAFGTVLYGAYANWVCTTFAAVAGTAAMTPLASAGFLGRPWQELLVTIGFATVALSMLCAAGLLLWGFRAGAVGRNAAGQ